MKKSLRVLLACPPSGNPYISELLRYVNKLKDVLCVQSHEELIETGELPYDVIHIQWPEAVFGWGSTITVNDVRVLSQRLSYFKQVGIKIVLTVHNARPHDLQGRIYSDLYETIYKKTDAFVHLGDKSVEMLKSSFDDLSASRHFVIPHGNYAFFNEVRVDGASMLPDKRRFRVLCFGAIRKASEIKIICQVADLLSNLGGELVVAGRINSGNKKTLNYYKMRIPLHLRHNIRLVKGRIPDGSVAGLISSCDALLIPRIDTLNSGNVALGFTFGKVVLGPNIGVIGEELAKLGNPTFEPSNYASLKSAVANLVDLVNSPLGQRNKTYAEKEMSWSKIARLHREVYLSL
jgi:beta-1,4-mannosyltransferase